MLTKTIVLISIGGLFLWFWLTQQNAAPPQEEKRTPRRQTPTAILQSTIGNTTHIVTTGEQIDARTEVVNIQPKEVTLSTNGQRHTLHLSIGF